MRELQDAGAGNGRYFLSIVTDSIVMGFTGRSPGLLVAVLPIFDTTGGFKCFRRNVLESIDLNSVKSNGYAFQIEMSYRAWKRGFQLFEIPIIFVDRTEGVSKMSKKIVREAIWMVWRLRWWSLTGRI